MVSRKRGYVVVVSLLLGVAFVVDSSPVGSRLQRRFFSAGAPSGSGIPREAPAGAFPVVPNVWSPYKSHVQLAAGDNHLCVLWRERGTVRCYAERRLGARPLQPIPDKYTNGKDCILRESPIPYDGQLGCVVPASYEDLQAGCEVTFPPSDRGTSSPKSRAEQIVAGRDFSCARTDQGAVFCWGHDVAGERASFDERKNPQRFRPTNPTKKIPLGRRTVQLVAGATHVCALLDEGLVRCWGNADHGELGYGNRQTVQIDGNGAPGEPVAVGRKVRELAAGASHTCALLDDSSVRCWGSAENGVLGYGPEPRKKARSADDVDILFWGYKPHDARYDIGDNETPERAGPVPLGTPVVQLVAGQEHTCALSRDGDVRCWGSSKKGQLGYASTETVGDDETPARARNVDVGGKVVQLAAGAWHTCARLASGDVRCWGHGDDGRLGYGTGKTIGDDEAPASAGNVPLGAPADEVTASGNYTCATLRTQTVRCWGNPLLAALGYPGRAYSYSEETPQRVGDSGGPTFLAWP